MNKTLASIVLAFAAACSGTQVVVNQQTAVAATNMEKGAADMVKSFATSTPPTGATSMGAQSTPSAGPVSIPITNVDVYTFQASLTGDGSDETLYWAAGGDGTIYVWGQIDLDCVDDNGNSTGETGVADLVYEANGQDYGWMTATDSCGYSTYFGCSSDDGGAEVCGGCDFNADFIACTALSS